MAEGVKYYPQWLCGNCHAGLPCSSKVVVLSEFCVWVLFLSLSKWKIPPLSEPKVKVLKMCRCLSACLPFITQRCFSTLCCCCSLFLTVGAPNFLNHWTSQVLDNFSLQCLILALSLLPNSWNIFLLSPSAFQFYALFFVFFNSILIIC